jgi:hypothetical protein
MGEECIESALFGIDEQSSHRLVAVIEELGEIFARFIFVLFDFLEQREENLQIASRDPQRDLGRLNRKQAKRAFEKRLQEAVFFVLHRDRLVVNRESADFGAQCGDKALVNWFAIRSLLLHCDHVADFGYGADDLFVFLCVVAARLLRGIIDQLLL